MLGFHPISAFQIYLAKKKADMKIQKQDSRKCWLAQAHRIDAFTSDRKYEPTNNTSRSHDLIK